MLILFFHYSAPTTTCSNVEHTSFEHLDTLDEVLDQFSFTDSVENSTSTTTSDDPNFQGLRTALLNSYNDRAYEARVAEIREIPPERRHEYFKGPILRRTPPGWGEPRDNKKIRDHGDIHWICGAFEDKSDVFIKDMAIRQKRECHPPSMVLSYFLEQLELKDSALGTEKSARYQQMVKSLLRQVYEVEPDTVYKIFLRKLFRKTHDDENWAFQVVQRTLVSTLKAVMKGTDPEHKVYIFLHEPGPPDAVRPLGPSAVFGCLAYHLRYQPQVEIIVASGNKGILWDAPDFDAALHEAIQAKEGR